MTDEVKICFPPSIDEHCTRLILGSMPGEASLRQQQYYAHPRNAFWPIMGKLLGFTPETTTYEERLGILLSHGIALWDTVGTCARRGSLDSNIDVIALNDFTEFLTRYSRISHVYFNGKTSYNFFIKYNRNLHNKNIILNVLPSSSPACAVLNMSEKLHKWSIIISNEVVQ